MGKKIFMQNAMCECSAKYNYCKDCPVQIECTILWNKFEETGD